MKLNEYNKYGPALIRLGLGLLFIIPGINKLLNPAGIIGMLTGLGFPMPTVFGWIVILSEIIFGICILLGFRVKYTVWPLVVILVVAALTVVVPGLPGSIVNLLFHILGILALISLVLTGPGKLALDMKK